MMSLSVCLLATARVCALPNSAFCSHLQAGSDKYSAVILFSPTNGLGQLTVLLLRVFTAVSDAAMLQRNIMLFITL